MQSTITLVRHGAVTRLSPNGQQLFYGPDVPLNFTGKEQMDRLARSLNALEVKPSIIYTSPTDRALESAHILQKIIQSHPPIVEKESLQTAYTPQWNDSPILDLVHSGGDIFAPNPARQGIRGESLDDVYARTTKEFANLRKEHNQDNIIIVTHSEVIGAIQHFIRVGEGGQPGIDNTIDKGEALLLRFDENGRLKESTVITPDEIHIRGEKER